MGSVALGGGPAVKRVAVMGVGILGAGLVTMGAYIGLETQLAPALEAEREARASAEARAGALEVERAFLRSRSTLETLGRTLARSPVLAAERADAEAAVTDPRLAAALQDVADQAGKGSAALLDERGAVLAGVALLGETRAARDAVATSGEVYRLESAEAGIQEIVVVPLGVEPKGFLVLSRPMASARVASWAGTASGSGQFAVLDDGVPVVSAMGSAALDAVRADPKGSFIEVGDRRYALAKTGIEGQGGRALRVVGLARVRSAQDMALPWARILVLGAGAGTALVFLIGLMGLGQTTALVQSPSVVPSVSTSAPPPAPPPPATSESLMIGASALRGANGGGGRSSASWLPAARHEDPSAEPPPERAQRSSASWPKVPPPSPEPPPPARPEGAPSASRSSGGWSPAPSVGTSEGWAKQATERAASSGGWSPLARPEGGWAPPERTPERSPFGLHAPTSDGPAVRPDALGAYGGVMSGASDAMPAAPLDIDTAPHSSAALEPLPPFGELSPASNPALDLDDAPLPPEPRTERQPQMKPSVPSFDAIEEAAGAGPSMYPTPKSDEDLPVPKGGLSPGMIAGQGLAQRGTHPSAPSPRLEENLPLPKEQAGHLYDHAPQPRAGGTDDLGGRASPLGSPGLARPASGISGLSQPRMPAVGAFTDEVEPFDSSHYRAVFEEFVARKRELGEPTENIGLDSFSAKLRVSEGNLIEERGCRAVRFQVIVKDGQVSLRPQLVRN